MTRLLALLERSSALLALLIALAAAGSGVKNGAFIAGGADSYGYLEEARLWRAGRLVVPQPFMAEVPWSNPKFSLTPLGFRPTSDGRSIVPVHAPGYPLLIAAAQAIAGYCAGAWVVPLSGALLVFATYVLGRLLGRPLAGLTAALLIATSPTFLYSLHAPMSDLPGAAAWTLALCGILARTPALAGAGGLAAAMGILIRPNTVLIAAVIAAFTPGRRRLWFASGAAVGVIVEGLVNAHLFGSPLRTGYSGSDFALAHFPRNVAAYGGWLLAAETPLALVGLAGTAWVSRRVRWLFPAIVAVAWLPVLFYFEFESWWYLRYMLPTWPLMMLGIAAAAGALWQRGGAAMRWPAVAAVAAMSVYGVCSERGRLTFGLALGEQKYVDAARLLANVAAPTSVVLATQHSGSIRYYAGRMTLRWDQLDPGEMDDVVTWLDDRGMHPLLVLDADEADDLRRRYGATDAAGRLDWPPLVALDGIAGVQVFDATGWRHRDREVITTRVRRSERAAFCPAPAAAAPRFTQ